MRTVSSTAIRTFEDLECWNRCRVLRLFVAKQVVPVLPREERYRLGDQLLRAARATTANIAEGIWTISLPRQREVLQQRAGLVLGNSGSFDYRQCRGFDCY